MRAKFFLVFLIVVLALVITGRNSYSQMQKQGNLYTMTIIPVPGDQTREFLDFFEKEGKTYDAQNEYVLSTKVYTHSWGPAWTVCLVAEYKDWEGFIAAEQKYGEIDQKMHQDQSARDDIGKKWGHYLTNHTDAIVFDHPNLQK